MTALPFPINEAEHAESFHLRLPRELVRQIDQLARDEHRTRANMLRLLLVEALESREKRKVAR